MIYIAVLMSMLFMVAMLSTQFDYFYPALFHRFIDRYKYSYALLIIGFTLMCILTYFLAIEINNHPNLDILTGLIYGGIGIVGMALTLCSLAAYGLLWYDNKRAYIVQENMKTVSSMMDNLRVKILLSTTESKGFNWQRVNNQSVVELQSQLKEYLKFGGNPVVVANYCAFIHYLLMSSTLEGSSNLANNANQVIHSFTTLMEQRLNNVLLNKINLDNDKWMVKPSRDINKIAQQALNDNDWVGLGNCSLFLNHQAMLFDINKPKITKNAMN